MVSGFGKAIVISILNFTMIKKYIKSNYPGLMSIRAKVRGLRFELRAYCCHFIGNHLLLRRQLAKKKKLHFGSGPDIKAGFINIDFNNKADIFLDARRRLNIQSNSIEYIYSSHFIEHLEHEELVVHLKECYRILESGGVLRLGIPVFEKVFRSYCDGNKEWLETRRKALSEKLRLPPELICAMDFINKAVYESGEHKTCIDMEKIRNLLIFSGFSPSAIKESEFDQHIDVSSRRDLTFFVEAVK
jgi:predicted SAM-dependent methyltransferase